MNQAQRLSTAINKTNQRKERDGDWEERTPKGQDLKRKIIIPTYHGRDVPKLRKDQNPKSRANNDTRI